MNEEESAGTAERFEARAGSSLSNEVRALSS